MHAKDTARQALVRWTTVGFLIWAVGIVIWCPCKRIGHCHWKKLSYLIAAAATVLLFENIIPITCDPATEACVAQ
jgi:hypothetical protein